MTSKSIVSYVNRYGDGLIDGRHGVRNFNTAFRNDVPLGLSTMTSWGEEEDGWTIKPALYVPVTEDRWEDNGR